jgi:hypothetical protein
MVGDLRSAAGEGVYEFGAVKSGSSREKSQAPAADCLEVSGHIDPSSALVARSRDAIVARGSRSEKEIRETGSAVVVRCHVWKHVTHRVS